MADHTETHSPNAGSEAVAEVPATLAQEGQPQAVPSAARLWARVLIFFIGLPLALMVLVKVYLG